MAVIKKLPGRGSVYTNKFIYVNIYIYIGNK